MTLLQWDCHVIFRRGEPQILDYQTQQYKLLPLVASAYAYWVVGIHIRDLYFATNYEIQQGNTEMLPEVGMLRYNIASHGACVWHRLYNDTIFSHGQYVTMSRVGNHKNIRILIWMDVSLSKKVFFFDNVLFDEIVIS